MKTTTYTELRKNLAQMMNSVNRDHEPLLITRGSLKPAVLMSLEEFNAISETLYLMSSPANAKRLNGSIKQLKAGKGKQRELLS